MGPHSKSIITGGTTAPAPTTATATEEGSGEFSDATLAAGASEGAYAGDMLTSRRLKGAGGAQSYGSGQIPASVFQGTGEPLDQYGGQMNAHGAVVFPSTEAMRAALNDMEVVQRMYAGEYGPQWQEIVSNAVSGEDPYTYEGIRTGQTFNVDMDPDFGADIVNYVLPAALAFMGGAGLGGMLGGGAIGAGAGAGLGGTAAGLMQGRSLEDSLRMGATTGLTAGIGQGLGGVFGNFGLGGNDPFSAMARGGILGTGMSLAQGEDFEDALRRGLVSGGTAGAINFSTPYLNDLYSGAQDWFGGLGGESFDPSALDMSALDSGFDIGEGMPGESLAEYGVQPGMTPVRSTVGGMITDPLTGRVSSSPAMTTFESADGGVTAEAPATAAYESLYPAEAAALSTAQLTPEQEAADAENLAELEAGDTPADEPEQAITEQDVARAVKVGKALVEMFGEEPSGPVRQEGQTDEEYAADLAEYIEVDLSPETMAELGLEPGTPEYYEYIMAEADAIIETMVGGLEGEELSAALRAMTEEEIAQLQRALYVRGQMDALVQAGSAQIDPVTGEAVQVGVEGGGLVDPGMGAYQSGLARDIQGITDIEDIYALLGRNFDPYGMQRAADARSELARRSETPDDELRLRRRGMLSR